METVNAFRASTFSVVLWLALMQMLMQKATSLNLAFVTLEVRVSNTPAVSLYRKFGFEDVGRRPAYYTLPTEDALLMTKILG